MSEDSPGEQKESSSVLTKLITNQADPLAEAIKFLGPTGARELALVSKDFSSFAGSDKVYNGFLRPKQLPISSQTELKQKPPSSNNSDPKLTENERGDSPQTELEQKLQSNNKSGPNLKENEKKDPPVKINILGRNSIFQEQKARRKFQNSPNLRSPSHYPRYVAGEFSDTYPVAFFSELAKDADNIEAQSIVAFWSIYKTKHEDSARKEHVGTILGIIKEHPTHTNSIYYFAKLLETKAIKLKDLQDAELEGLGSIIYQGLRKEIGNGPQSAECSNLQSQLENIVTSETLYKAILLLEPSHPGASFERARYLKNNIDAEAKAKQVVGEKDAKPKTLTAAKSEIYAEIAKLLRNVWRIEYRNFEALYEFIDLMYQGLIEPTKEDFAALNRLLVGGRTEPTKTIDKLQIFVDYAITKIGSGERNGQLQNINRQLSEDREAISSLPLLTQYFEFLKDIEQLPYKQQRLFSEAVKAAKAQENQKEDVFFITGLVLYNLGICAVSIASAHLAIGESLGPGEQIIIFVVGLIAAWLFALGKPNIELTIMHQQILGEESAIVSQLQQTFDNNWTVFFPEMDKKKRQQESILELHLLPEQRREGINEVLENFSILSLERQNLIVSAAHSVDVSYKLKLSLAKKADALIPWLVVAAILAPSSYAMYTTHQIQINKSLSLRMETILGEVVLASLIAYMVYMCFSRNVPKVLTNNVNEERLNAMVASVAQVAKQK